MHICTMFCAVRLPGQCSLALKSGHGHKTGTSQNVHCKIRLARFAHLHQSATLLPRRPTGKDSSVRRLQHLLEDVQERSPLARGLPLASAGPSRLLIAAAPLHTCQHAPVTCTFERVQQSRRHDCSFEAR